MPNPPYRPKDLQWQLFLGAAAQRQGLLTPAHLRTTAWRRLGRDVYADSRFERDHELACRGVALRLPAEAAIAGPSAAYLHGVLHAAQSQDDVHVIMPPPGRLGRRRGVVVHATRLTADEVARIADLRLTTPARTAWDLAAWLDPVVAVPIIDGLLGLGLVEPHRLAVMADQRAGGRGARRAAAAFGLADGRAQSPPESRLRVRFVLAGLPPPVPQHPVRLSSGLVLHPDLAWPEFRVAVEYDGQWHADADQLRRDRRRLNQLVADGWLVIHVTGDRLRRDFGGVLGEVRTTLISRGWRPTRH
jgi:hypothetical protein